MRTTMTTKEKAEELVGKFMQFTPADPVLEFKYAKQCALIAVDEIIKEGACEYGITAVEYGRENFWYKVKQEIEKLL